MNYAKAGYYPAFFYNQVKLKDNILRLYHSVSLSSQISDITGRQQIKNAAGTIK